MASGHGGRRLRREFVELAGGDAHVDAGANLLRDQHGIAVLLAEAIAQPLEPRRDLVEANWLSLAAQLHDVHLGREIRRAGGGVRLGSGLWAEKGMRVSDRLGGAESEANRAGAACSISNLNRLPRKGSNRSLSHSFPGSRIGVRSDPFIIPPPFWRLS